jgi:hypothetical protein
MIKSPAEIVLIRESVRWGNLAPHTAPALHEAGSHGNGASQRVYHPAPARGNFCYQQVVETRRYMSSTGTITAKSMSLQVNHSNGFLIWRIDMEPISSLA